MGVVVSKQPHYVDFLRNRNGFGFVCNDAVRVGAVASLRVMGVRIDRMPIGSELVVMIDGEEYAFRVAVEPSGAYEIWAGERLVYLDEEGNDVTPVVLPPVPPRTVWEEAALTLGNCYYIGERFVVEVYEGEGLRLTAREVGRHQMGVMARYSNGRALRGIVESVTLTPGLDIERRENYGLAVQLQVAAGGGDAVGASSDWMAFEANGDGGVCFVPDMLGGFFGAQGLPDVAAGVVPVLVDGAMLRYRVRYCEMWGRPARMQRVMADSWHYMLDGELVSGFAEQNRPDWMTGNEDALSVWSERAWVLGASSGEVRHVRAHTPAYLYIMCTAGCVVSVEVKVWRLNGEVAVVSDVFSIEGCSVYRIGAGVAGVAEFVGVNEEEVYMYEVSVQGAGDAVAWSRRYVVEADLYERHYFLLTNKYGLLEAMDAEGVTVEMVTEGESLTVGGRHDVNVTDAHQLWKVRTAALTDEEKRLIGQAQRGRHNYYWADGMWKEIKMEPGSLSVAESAEDVSVAEFEFRFVENGTENVAAEGVDVVAAGGVGTWTVGEFVVS